MLNSRMVMCKVLSLLLVVYEHAVEVCVYKT